MGQGRDRERGGTSPTSVRFLAPVGAVLLAVAAAVPEGVRGWVVLALIAPAGPLVALAVRRYAPERRAQWLCVAVAGVALATSWLGTLLDLAVVVVPAEVAVYASLASAAHMAMGRPRRHRWVLAVDAVAIGVVGAALATWVRSGVVPAPPTWTVLQAGGDLVLVAYLVALVHHRVRVTASVALVGAALALLVADHAVMWWVDPAAAPGAAPLSAVLLVGTAVLATAAAWHPSMSAFGDLVSPLVPPRRQALAIVPVVLVVPLGALLAQVGVVPDPGPDVRLVLAVAVVVAVLLLALSFWLAASVEQGLLETDPLTRAGSRLALERMLATQIHLGGSPVRLCVVELDDVAALALRQGRHAADTLLVEHVEALRTGLPDTVVCRTGAQTLAVLAPVSRRGDRGTPLGFVAAVLARLGPADGSGSGAAATGVHGVDPARPSSTAAVLTVPPRTDVPREDLRSEEIVSRLLEHAELSLLAARDAGVPVEADVERDGAYERARRLDLDLAGAMAATGQIAVHYQPLVDPRTGRTRSLEALVRWEHPELGPVAPDDFLEAAQLQGRARELDDLARRRALADIGRWRQDGLDPPRVAVNLSAESLESPDLVDRVLADLRASGEDACSLLLEVVEHHELRDLRTVADRLQRLHDAGVGVAVDDFGVGHAALQYLLHFPVDSVKLDRSLVAEVGTPQGRAFLGSAVALVHSLEATAVAEGVEDDVQMGAVAELGFDLAQGFFCGRPAPADATARLLAAERAAQELPAGVRSAQPPVPRAPAAPVRPGPEGPGQALP